MIRHRSRVPHRTPSELRAAERAFLDMARALERSSTAAEIAEAQALCATPPRARQAGLPLPRTRRQQES